MITEMEIRNMRCENLETDRGNPARNQFYLYDNQNNVFISYDSIICIVGYESWDYETDMPIPVLGRDWDYSVTTMKYLYKFLEMMEVKLPSRNKKQAIQKMIDSGLFRYDPNLY